MPGIRRMLGEILEEMGCVTEEDVQTALEAQMGGENKKLGEILQAKGVVTAEDVTRALAEQHDIEMVDIEGIEIPGDVIELVPRDFARQHNIIPIELLDGVLTVAMSDPLDLYALDNLRFIINSPVEHVLATEESIKAALAHYYGLAEDEVEQMLTEFTETELEFVESDTGDDEADASDDAPVIRLVSLIIANAVKARASDIHIEPMTNRLRIRYRVDGTCFEVEPPPKRLQGPILSRIKIMAGMDMAEKRRPQDGRIKITLSGRGLDLRVSALPATHGESMVMRILDKESLLLGLPDLGFHPDDHATFNSLIKKPNGILLITGPTGSGKTTTLYAALNTLNTADRKIITAEEPVEYHITGLNQCEVRKGIGMTFQRILRAMLRQAPEIILVGEIRDRETADIAIQAALTGHLVFSTLHTNDAPTAVTRLIDMGVAPFLVASSIQAIMAQRLVKVICQECRQPAEPDRVKLKAFGITDDQIDAHEFFEGTGCDNCRNSGFRGRKGIFEMMVMNNRLREMAFNKATTEAIREQALKDGMYTLFRDGLRKVLTCMTTLQEVLSVAKVSS